MRKRAFRDTANLKWFAGVCPTQAPFVVASNPKLSRGATVVPHHPLVRRNARVGVTHGIQELDWMTHRRVQNHLVANHGYRLDLIRLSVGRGDATEMEAPNSHPSGRQVHIPSLPLARLEKASGCSNMFTKREESRTIIQTRVILESSILANYK
jgi:hypothetical protein